MNNSASSKRLMATACLIVMVLASAWFVTNDNKTIAPIAKLELIADNTTDAVVERAGGKAEIDVIAKTNTDDGCLLNDAAEESIIYYQQLLETNLNNVNFAQLKLGSRYIELPDGSFELTGHHKYLENLSLAALEAAAKSGDQEAMVALSDRLIKNWVTKINSPIADIHTDDFNLNNPQFVKGLENIDSMIDRPEYTEAKKWALNAAEFGKFTPLNYEIMPALDEQHTLLSMKLDFSKSNQERAKIREMLKNLEREHYKIWRMYQYSYELEGNPKPTFDDSYEPDYISKEELQPLKKESIEELKQLEEKVRNNGASMPRELMATLAYTVDPDQIIDSGTDHKIYNPEEFANMMGSEEFAKYSEMGQEADQKANDCLAKLQN